MNTGVRPKRGHAQDCDYYELWEGLADCAMTGDIENCNRRCPDYTGEREDSVLVPGGLSICLSFGKPVRPRAFASPRQFRLVLWWVSLLIIRIDIDRTLYALMTKLPESIVGAAFKGCKLYGGKEAVVVGEWVNVEWLEYSAAGGRQPMNIPLPDMVSLHPGDKVRLYMEVER